ncbi:hypothetical protein ACP70R_027078 [Stipagrostis hirtigluma subsp. patula]
MAPPPTPTPTPQQIEEMRSRAEEMLRQRSSKGNMATNLALLGLGVLFALWGALEPRLSKNDRIALWAAAALDFLSGAGFLCFDVYLVRKMKQVLAEMQSAMDLESAGDLRFASGSP